MNTEEAVIAAERIGYPVLVRPSYVLGGRSMEIIYDSGTLRQFMVRALEVSPGHPILVDKFLEDRRGRCRRHQRGTETVVAGSWSISRRDPFGDSACVLSR